MASDRISDKEWAKLEELSQESQRIFLKTRESDFHTEPVNEQTRNVKRGDHLYRPGIKVRKKHFYEHHMICTDASDYDIEAVEYDGLFSGFSASSRSSATKNPLVKCRVTIARHTYEELESREAKIIQWPEELERYTTDEVIEKAKNQVGESLYHLLDNNCESLVVRCKCGLNTSLQVKPSYRNVCEFITAVGSAIAHSLRVNLLRLLLSLVANLLDDAARFASSSLSWVGFVAGAAIDVGIAIYDIYQEKKKADKRIISQTEFRQRSMKIVFQTVGRIAGGIGGALLAGSLLGTATTVATVSATIALGICGALVGHFVLLGVACAIIYLAPKIAKVAKKVYNTCVSYAKRSWQKVKRFVMSMFFKTKQRDCYLVG